MVKVTPVSIFESAAYIPLSDGSAGCVTLQVQMRTVQVHLTACASLEDDTEVTS